MALTKEQKLRSDVFKTLNQLGAKWRWVKGWEVGVELPDAEWREIRRVLGAAGTRWGWRVVSRCGTGGGYRLVRHDG